MIIARFLAALLFICKKCLLYLNSFCGIYVIAVSLFKNTRCWYVPVMIEVRQLLMHRYIIRKYSYQIFTPLQRPWHKLSASSLLAPSACASIILSPWATPASATCGSLPDTPATLLHTGPGVTQWKSRELDGNVVRRIGAQLSILGSNGRCVTLNACEFPARLIESRALTILAYRTCTN